MKRIIFLTTALCFIFQSNFSYADDDPYAAAMNEHNSIRSQKADAHATKVYGAWAEDMANQIKSGKKEGLVYDGENGIGNVTIERGSKVTGPIIVNPKIDNSTVIFTSPKKSRF
ncbi:MAG: hypothetical protein IKJ34_00820 [Mailhella sp.]|nr:hypothetical protein [Mailhella sp.]MBR3880133.1 hypothetical protein [Mailhella sp.]